MALPNNPEVDFWERRADAWDRGADSVSGFSDEYGRPAMEGLNLHPGDRVADVGCGPGTTVVQLAKLVGPTGAVLALDISAAMVAVTTRRAEAAGLSNVEPVVHDLEEAPVATPVDAVYSRFGVMFFRDPGTAFANLAKSLRPGGRLGCCVWSELGQNPWMFVPTLASAGILGAELALPGPGEPGPFSLADAGQVAELLDSSGFVDVEITSVSGGRIIERSAVNDEIRTLLEMGPVADAYVAADLTTRAAAIEAVRGAIGPFEHGDGWLLPGAALVVAARTPSDS